jgi:1-phosphofructokinase family hexose kinase
MILTVTLNPCLDKTLTVPGWSPGDNVRGRAVRELVGGKGINVARALGRLGREVRPATFLGGHVGTHCHDLLRTDDHLDALITATAAPTRVIVTVRTEASAEQTAFFDPDPEITPAESDALYRTVSELLAAGRIQALTLSGSSPCPATHSLFRDLIAGSRARGVPVFLDTYGPALDRIAGVWPDAIQLNRREAAAYLRKTGATLGDCDVVELLDRWSCAGVRCAIVTDGPRPMFAQVCGRRYRALPPAIEAVNPIGSGDCLLAGITDAWLDNLEPEAMLRRGLACAVANALVWDAGGVDPHEVSRQEPRIIVEAG